jgi:hypothetical protein
MVLFKWNEEAQGTGTKDLIPQWETEKKNVKEVIKPVQTEFCLSSLHMERYLNPLKSIGYYTYHPL